LEEEAQVESETKPVTSTEAPMSNSEKNLRKKYNSEKNPETLQEKAERKRKQREEKAKAESSEEESSNEPEP